MPNTSLRIEDEENFTYEQMKEAGLTGLVQESKQRSIYWRVYLRVFEENSTKSQWIAKTELNREKYDKMKAETILDPHKLSADPVVDNPLSQSDNSVWKQYFEDEELQKEIKQDIVRTYPEKEFFQDKAVQDMMLNILFVYSKTIPEVSYRQGMHELLAPIIYLLDKEKGQNDNSVLETITDPKYVEHDAYAMFERLMSKTVEWFRSDHGKAVKQKKDGTQVMPEDSSGNSIVRKCNKIQNVLLKEKDPQLHKFLNDLNIEPQIYLLRWVRLILGREFHLEDLYILWDGIFAYDTELTLLNYICVAMLIFIRSQLIGQDHFFCLKRLFKYPPVESVSIFITQAVQLINEPAEQRYLPLPLSPPLIPDKPSSLSTTNASSSPSRQPLGSSSTSLFANNGGGTSPTSRLRRNGLAGSTGSASNSNININTNNNNSAGVQMNGIMSGTKSSSALNVMAGGSSPASAAAPSSSTNPFSFGKKRVFPKMNYEQLENEILKHRANEQLLSSKIDAIIYTLQTKLFSPDINYQKEDDTIQISLALAELKQVKDVLSGSLPLDMIHGDM